MTASARRRELLRFVVEETLAGRTEQLKGFTILEELLVDPVARYQKLSPVAGETKAVT